LLLCKNFQHLSNKDISLVWTPLLQG
jgi:hypothetical protein